ncbi:MAG: flagellar export protein FliJ [Nitratireductor sp.]
MKSRDNLMRLKHFQVQDRTRQLAQIDMMVHEMTKMSDDLKAQIRIEEEKSGIADVTHFAYPTFAKAARQRHENLLVSIRDLNDKRQAAEDALSEAEEDLKKAQALESRDGSTGVSDQVVDAQVERRAMIG